MKRILLGSAVLLSASLNVYVEAADKKAVVATTGDIKPFSCQNKKGQLAGYDIQVIKVANKHINDYKIGFKKTARDSIFIGLDDDIHQVAANDLSYTEKRANRYLYSVSIAKDPSVLVVGRGSKVTSLDDIGGKTTQDDAGTSAARFVDDWNSQHNDNPSTADYSGEDVTKCLLDLDGEEFDYLIFDKISVGTIIKQKNLDLTVTELNTDDDPSNYIISSGDNRQLQTAFGKAVKKLCNNGTLEKLSQKHLDGSYLPEALALEVSR